MCVILTTMSNNYGNYHRGHSLWWGEEGRFKGQTLNIKTTSNFLFVTKLHKVIFYTEMQSTINYPYNPNRPPRGIYRNSLLQTDRKIVWKQFENNIEYEYENYKNVLRDCVNFSEIEISNITTNLSPF